MEEGAERGCLGFFETENILHSPKVIFGKPSGFFYKPVELLPRYPNLFAEFIHGYSFLLEAACDKG